MAVVHLSFGGGESDVLGAATSFGIGIMNGLGGDDYYIITQYQQSDAISDDTGTNVIKFDYGVEITGPSLGGRQVPSFTVTLESGAEISIASPKGTLSYQIGDGGVLDYDQGGDWCMTNAGSALANSFPVPPVVADDYGASPAAVLLLRKISVKMQPSTPLLLLMPTVILSATALRVVMMRACLRLMRVQVKFHLYPVGLWMQKAHHLIR